MPQGVKGVGSAKLLGPRILGAKSQCETGGVNGYELYPPYQGGAAREAAELVRFEMRRVVAVMTGNFAYWGLPDAERPTAAPGAIEQANAEAKAAEAKHKNRPRRRPARFAEE